MQPVSSMSIISRYANHRRDKGNDFSKLTIAWIGDGNNMCNSYINASKLLNFRLKISVPNGYEPINIHWINLVKMLNYVRYQVLLWMEPML